MVANETKKKTSIKLNAIFNFVSQFLTVLLPVLSTPYLSRVLHEEGTGQVSYAVSIVSIFLVLANVGLDAYGQREIAKAKDDVELKSKVFWELVLMRTITSAISIGIFLLMFFTIGFYKANTIVLIYGVALIGNIFDINFFFRGEEDFRTVAIRNIALKVLALIGIFVFVKAENDTWIYALILGGSYFLSAFLMWPALRKRIVRYPWRKLQLKRHFLPAFRIFLPSLAVTLYSLLDKVEIGLFAANSDYENGCYEQAFKINNTSLFLVTMFSSVLAPRSAYEYQTKDMDSFYRHVALSFRFVFMMALPLIVGFFFLSENLCSWFLGPGYEKAPTVLKILSLKYLLSGCGMLLNDQVFVPIGKEKYAGISAGIALAVNVAINIPLIIYYGAIGAAIATAVSEFVNLALLLFFAIRQKLVYPKQVMEGFWRYCLCAGAMAGLVYGLMFIPGSSDSIWIFFIIVFSSAAFYFGLLLLLREPMIADLVRSVLQKIKRKRIKKGEDDSISS